MGEMNGNRAAWAAHAIEAFQAMTGTDPADAMVDLLADLMHLAGAEGADFEAALATARMHYDAEILDDE